MKQDADERTNLSDDAKKNLAQCSLHQSHDPHHYKIREHDVTYFCTGVKKEILEKTQELLLEALSHPKLQEPGGCTYLDSERKSCIAGTVLRLAGAPNDLLANASRIVISSVEELVKFCNQNDLNIFLLQKAQNLWDNSSCTTQDIVRLVVTGNLER